MFKDGPRKSVSEPRLLQPQQEGEAFGGKLRFHFVRKDSGGANFFRKHSSEPMEPVGEVIDYFFLRLKFLLKKAKGQGASLLELFEHFDTDFDGEIDVVGGQLIMDRFKTN